MVVAALFSSAGTVRLVDIEGKMDAGKPMDGLEESRSPLNSPIWVCKASTDTSKKMHVIKTKCGSMKY